MPGTTVKRASPSPRDNGISPDESINCDDRLPTPAGACPRERGNNNAASLKLRVASDIARWLSANLVASVAKAGGRAIDQSVSAEDVSKEISDTNARIRQRELLIQRLAPVA